MPKIISLIISNIFLQNFVFTEIFCKFGARILIFITMGTKLCLRLLAIMLIWLSVPFGANSQLKVTSDAFLLGENAQTTNGIRFVVEGKNGLFWKYKDHHLRLNLRGTYPALYGTNGWFYFASFHFSETQPTLVEMVCHDIYLLSDERAKTNITDLSTALGRVNALQLQRTETDATTDKRFSVKNMLGELNRGSNNQEYLLSTETIEENFPTLVDKEPDGKAYVDYIGLVPVLIQSVKEAREAVDKQSEMIKVLRQKLEEL